jgi:prepilin peptidase CpaA
LHEPLVIGFTRPRCGLAVTFAIRRLRLRWIFGGSRAVFELAILTVLPGAVAFAAAMDLLTLQIPNRISIALLIAFVPLGILAGLDAWAFLEHVLAGTAMLGVGILLFIPGWFGGGDAKLLAAIALWVGFDHLASYLFHVALAGGMIALLISAARAMPLPRLLLGEPWALRLHRHDAGIPYGLALAAGALLVYPQTIWFASLGH